MRTLRFAVVHAVLARKRHNEPRERVVAALVVAVAYGALHHEDDVRECGVEGLEIEAELCEDGREGGAPVGGVQGAQRGVEAPQRLHGRASLELGLRGAGGAVFVGRGRRHGGGSAAGVRVGMREMPSVTL